MPQLSTVGAATLVTWQAFVMLHLPTVTVVATTFPLTTSVQVPSAEVVSNVLTYPSDTSTMTTLSMPPQTQLTIYR